MLTFRSYAQYAVSNLLFHLAFVHRHFKHTKKFISCLLIIEGARISSGYLERTSSSSVDSDIARNWSMLIERFWRMHIFCWRSSRIRGCLDMISIWRGIRVKGKVNKKRRLDRRILMITIALPVSILSSHYLYGGREEFLKRAGVLGPSHTDSHSKTHGHSHSEGPTTRKKFRPSESNMDKLRSTLKQFVRDWSSEVCLIVHTPHKYNY